MSATLSDPILLANYALPSSSGKRKQGDNFFDGFSTVYASHSQVAGTSDGHVTVAAQRDGLHILDLSDLHPLQSNTLGPSTSFACAPLTIVSSSNGVLLRRTYAAMQSGQGMGKEDEGKVLWCWSSPLNDESAGALGEKQSSSLTHRVCSIVKAEKHAVCISRECDVSVVGEDLQSLSHWKPSEEHHLVKAFAYPRQKCSLSATSSTQPGTLIFLFMRYISQKTLRLHVLTVSQKGESSLVDAQDCPLQNPERVIDISCDPSGHLSFIESDGSWTHVRAEIREGRLSLYASDRIRLKGLLFTSQALQKQHHKPPHSSVSILALRSSFVLLAGLTSPSSREVAILLWDIQYGVLLSSHMLSVPSAFEDVQPSSISVSLVHGSSTQALLSVSPFASHEIPLPSTSSGQLHSSLLVLPFTLPAESTIASAIGRSSHGSKWLVEVSDVPQELKLAPNDDAVLETIDEPRERLLEAMQEAMEDENPRKAEALFFDWHQAELRKVEERDAGESKQIWQSPWKREVYINDLFIRRLVEVSLQPDNPRNKKHSSGVVRFLLEKRTVGHVLVEGGLLPALLRYNDWDAIFFALRRVPDIPENVLMWFLLVVVKNHQKTTSNPATTDSEVGCPSLHVFLAACLNYPASSVPARAAIREHFKDAEDIYCLLEVLAEWLDYWCEEKFPLLHERKEKREKGRKKQETALPRGSTDTPELPSILFFLQAILDSSFISLLQHPASHSLLRQILSLISPQIEYNESLEQLRGPLEPFSTKTAMDAGEKENKESGLVHGNEKKETKSEVRRRMREQREMDELRIGAYQIEEVFL